ncbi:MAG TPA: hypothetical protein VKV26_07565 [Dehalococcoidia bacterium]|nr:hypothetical protein [Dehalococcoidia bacterium]
MKHGSRRTEQPNDGTASAGLVPRPSLSAAQIAAIFGAMRTFRDDDLARSLPAETMVCDRCGRERSAAGALAYGELRFCNGCATDYELLRMAGLERDLLHPRP